MNIAHGYGIIKKAKFYIKQFIRHFSNKDKLKTFGENKDLINAIYIINLKRQPKRWERIIKETRHQKMVDNGNLSDFCYRIPAIDGKIQHKALNSQDVKDTYDLKDQYNIDPDPRLLSIIREREVIIKMTKEEIAVSLSHIEAWKRIIKEKQSSVLILEDDIFFEYKFSKQLNHAWDELPKNYDLLYVSYREVEWGAEKRKFSDYLNQPIRGYWWLSGYILSYQGAKKLLGLLPIIGPIDLWINHQFNKLNVFSTVDSIIFQREDLKSDNNYSILPVLSQVGIQSDKTHLELEQKKGKNPVFVLGSLNLGTRSLSEALSLLGYRCYNRQFSYSINSIDQLIEEGAPLLFDAYIGVSGILESYKKLEIFYQDAVFILMGRNDGVQDFFKAKKNKLLVIDAQDSKDWNKLCEFLDCDIPSYSFPVIEHIREYENKELSRIKISINNTTILRHDVHPWVIPYEKLPSFGVCKSKYGTQRSYFKNIISDSFDSLNESHWDILEHTFPSNLAVFTKGNISLVKGKGLQMCLKSEKSGGKKYSSASIASSIKYQYGRFEAIIKPVKVEGVITALFLHRNDPWQEIDFEFLGNDTTKALINVYYNPGSNGTLCNFGNRGTPITIDLGFDASLDYHKYVIEWEPHEVRWFVDNKLVHVRSEWEPTPIPSLPMELHINIWPSMSEELVGKIIDSELPVKSYLKSINISTAEINT